MKMVLLLALLFALDDKLLDSKAGRSQVQAVQAEREAAEARVDALQASVDAQQLAASRRRRRAATVCLLSSLPPSGQCWRRAAVSVFR